MKVFFQNRPSNEEISHYEEKLNYFLQYLDAKVKIKIFKEPIRIESFINNIHTDTTYYWVDYLEVVTPEISIKADIFSQHFGHNGNVFDEKYAWIDAFEIQEKIYKELRRNFGLPYASEDPYWKLWELK